MEIAIKSMKKGERAKFLFSYKYAYGRLGCPPRVPERADVMAKSVKGSAPYLSAKDMFSKVVPCFLFSLEGSSCWIFLRRTRPRPC